MDANRPEARRFSRVFLIAAVLALLAVPVALVASCQAKDQTDMEDIVSPDQDMVAPEGSESGSGNVVD